MHLKKWSHNQSTNVKRGCHINTKFLVLEMLLMLLTATISVTKIRKPPNISNSNGIPHTGKKKFGFAVPVPPLQIALDRSDRRPPSIGRIHLVLIALTKN